MQFSAARPIAAATPANSTDAGPDGSGRARRALGARALGAVALCTWLAGCSSMSGPKIEVDKAAVERYRSSGYIFPTQEGVGLHRFAAPVTQIPWSFTLAEVPGHGANRRIILFFPPLGDADDAPCLWMDVWARAGYAVISIQAFDDDARIWTTSDARSGDFERVARARFSDELMSDRIVRLSALVAQTRARSLAGEPALAGLDWTRVALVGADLGAYTVQSIARMTPEQLAAVHWPLQPAAYIAISPYARQKGTEPTAIAARAPVLMISSRDDVDAYGVITDVSLRHLAFDDLVSGDDYYLELGSASHRWLGGITADQQNSPEAMARRTPTFREPSVSNARKRSGGSGSDGVAPEDEDLPPEATAKLAASRKEREAQAAKARSRQLTRAAQSEVSFTHVSIAFLDAYLRQDGRAHTWLLNAAPTWLQDGDRLKHR